MKSQKKLIQNREWDVLILLDACRYDIFKKCFKRHIEGTLKKVISEGSCTLDWLKGTFKESHFNDVVYVSGNPYINSKGISIHGFDGTNHFYKIIDAWESGWIDEIKTVKPDVMGKKTRLARAKYPGKKIISHFAQPHYPYLSEKLVYMGGFTDAFYKATNERNRIGLFSQKIREIIGRIMNRVLGWRLTQMIRKKLSLIELIGDPRLKKFAQKYGTTYLKNAYEENLILALTEVQNIIDRLPDNKIVITSDHGELLGEDGIYGHPEGLNHNILIEVPWLEINH